MGGLIRRVAFPRVFCPLSAMVAHTTNLVASLLFLGALMAYYRVELTLQALWIVPLLLVTAALALGLGLLASALNVYTRDVRTLVALAVQIWFFGTPIFYPLSMVEGPLARHGLLTLYKLNPMLHIVEGLRAALLRGEAPGIGLAAAAGLAVALLAVGLAVFTRLERNFADVV